MQNGIIPNDLITRRSKRKPFIYYNQDNYYFKIELTKLQMHRLAYIINYNAKHKNDNAWY